MTRQISVNLPPLEITTPPLYPAQEPIAKHPARFRVMCCGRRFGKGFLSGVCELRTGLSGGKVWHVSPDYPASEIHWRLLRSQAQKIPIAVIRESERMITFQGVDGYIQIKSAGAGLRGEGLDLLVIDEAAHIADLETLWLEDLRPTLSDRQGRALFASTPNGLNYFHRLWSLGNDPTETDWHSWQLPTACNPYILPAEIEAARKGMTQAAFDQEYLAQFNPDGGAVFRYLDKVCILLPQARPIEGHRYFFGVDWGRTYDATVISVFDATVRQQVSLDRFTDTAWELQRGRLKALYSVWKPETILAEENSIGSPNIEALQREGLPVKPFQTTAQSKPELIEGLALAIEKGALGEKEGVLLLGGDDPNGKVQLAELQAYAMERTDSGRYVYSAPSGGHDDTVIGTALSIKAAHTLQQIKASRVRWA